MIKCIENSTASDAMHPADPALQLFARHFRLDLQQDRDALLRQVVRAFTNLPYENLSKVVCEAERGRVPEARRYPQEVITDHIRLGTGGTCFSLTATLMHLLRELGWEAEPILADRPYGPNTHCALLLWRDGQPHLLDPGFLLTDPIPLPRDQPVLLPTSFHQVRLCPRQDGRYVDLYVASPQGQEQHRITFKTSPVDWSEFVRVWDASFDWDMMRYPLLTRVCNGEHIYLKGNRLQRRTLCRVERQELSPVSLAEHIHRLFGIAPEVVYRALAVWKRRGERHG
jgi:arylamine N-acetyltransferase